MCQMLQTANRQQNVCVCEWGKHTAEQHVCNITVILLRDYKSPHREQTTHFANTHTETHTEQLLLLLK